MSYFLHIFHTIFFAQAAASLEAIGGYDVETMGKPLDPLNLAKYIPAETLRKYETVHCRVAMLACVGYAFPREFHGTLSRKMYEYIVLRTKCFLCVRTRIYPQVCFTSTILLYNTRYRVDSWFVLIKMVLL